MVLVELRLKAKWLASADPDQDCLHFYAYGMNTEWNKFLQPIRITCIVYVCERWAIPDRFIVASDVKVGFVSAYRVESFRTNYEHEKVRNAFLLSRKLKQNFIQSNLELYGIHHRSLLNFHKRTQKNK